MGRLSQLLILSSLSLVAGVALGQTGLIVEPWRQPSAPALPAVSRQPMPASGLPQVAAAAPRAAESRAPAPTASFPDSERWSPPVIELLVDPWAKARVTAPPAPRRWVPSSIEIVDPWAGSEPAPPRIASRPSRTPPSTIF